MMFYSFLKKRDDANTAKEKVIVLIKYNNEQTNKKPGSWLLWWPERNASSWRLQDDGIDY